jgi:NADPH:quinone reductase-like Zn-dependent oxidoreductase
VEFFDRDVNRLWLGKTVSTLPAFPANKYGVYWEVAIVLVTAIAEYPAHLSFEEDTSISMQYLAAYGALIREGKLLTDDFVLMTTASSRVGIAAIEIAKAEGSISIATTRSGKKKAQLLELGANDVVVTAEKTRANASIRSRAPKAPALSSRRIRSARKGNTSHGTGVKR